MYTDICIYTCTFISLSFSIMLWLFHFLLFACLFSFFQQIRNVFGAKSAKAYSKNSSSSSGNNTTSNSSSSGSSKINPIDEVNGQRNAVLNPAASDLYVSQLKNFIAKNSTNPSDCRTNERPKSKQAAQTESHHQQHHQHLSNSLESSGQYKQFKRKCKRAVYKFMKGLFDERKLKKFALHQQPEPIYFEVSQSTRDCRPESVCAKLYLKCDCDETQRVKLKARVLEWKRVHVLVHTLACVRYK